MIENDQTKELQSQQSPTPNKDGFVAELASFFDLLARFDYEDKQKEKSEINTGSLASAPKESMLVSN